MAKQETLTIFPEIEAITRMMTNEQFGELMRAVMAYRFRGEAYNGTDVAVFIAFQFMSNQVDRSETAKAARTKAANDRWNASADANTMQTDASAMQIDAKPMQTDANTMQTDASAMQIDAPIQSSPVHSIPIHKESIAAEPHAPAKKSRKSYGQFGWVKLSDEDYNRLLNDLGEAEVKRCIAYIDEAAQATGNKNKWRDWNLVIRKCSRDGWGKQKQASYGKPDIPKGASGTLGEAELAAIRRVMAGD